MAQKYTISKYATQTNMFGGCDVIVDVLRKNGMKGFIDSLAGKRAPRAEYKYSEGIITWFLNLCCGGDCFEDIENIRVQMRNHPRFLNSRVHKYKEGMSPDTFSKMCKELSVPNIYFEKDTHKIKTSLKKPKKKSKKKSKKKAKEKLKSNYSTHEVNDNAPMNNLLLETVLKLGLLKRNHPYILDFDATHIVTKISDSRKYFSGKGKRAYCPAMASINDIPVYFENRNGDTPSSWNLKETIEKIINALEAKGISISIVRIDGAAYVNEFVKYMNSRNLKYVTRVRKDSGIKQSEKIINWEIEELRGVEVEIGEKEFRFGGSLQRLVMTHKIQDDTYWAILSNIEDITKKDLCLLYNRRSGADGICEHIFQSLKYDFVLDYPPLRKFEYNTVFLLISAICYCLFKYFVRLFYKKLKLFSSKIQLKKFINCFIKGETTWVDGELILHDEISAMYARLSGFT